MQRSEPGAIKEPAGDLSCGHKIVKILQVFYMKRDIYLTGFITIIRQVYCVHMNEWSYNIRLPLQVYLVSMAAG